MPSKAWAAALLVLGCGYRLVDPAGALGPDLDRIEIRPLENHSNEPTLERVLADALVEEFARRGALRPVYEGGRDRSGLHLAGVIREFETRPTSFSSVSLALEHEIRLVVELDLSRGETETPLWRQHRITLRERYLASADPGVEQSNKEQALRRMASELAGRVHDGLLETF